MKVYVLYAEYNRGADSEGSASLLGVFADELTCRRAKWDAMREHITEYHHNVYGRRTEDDWDVDLHVEERQVHEAYARSVRPAWTRKVVKAGGARVISRPGLVELP